VQNFRVILYQIASPVAVMSVGVQNSEPLDAETLTQDPHGNHHVIKAAVTAKKVSSRMMASGSNESETIGDFTLNDFLGRKDYATNRMPGGGT
jgi:hypothetical protein